MKEGALTPEEIKALFSDSETAPGEDQIDRKIELGLEPKKLSVFWACRSTGTLICRRGRSLTGSSGSGRPYSG